MKKFIYISSLLLFISISVNAQLTMNWNKKFSIGPETEDFVPLLMVNNDWFFIEGEDTCSIGTGGAPYALNGNNIGVFGGFCLNPNYSQDSNHPYL